MTASKFTIEVVTSDAAGNQVGESRTFNLCDHGARAWMAKHCWWAAHQGFAVHSRPVAALDPVTGQPMSVREQFESECG